MKLSILMPKLDDWSHRDDFNVFIESHLSYISKNFIVERKEVTDNIGSIYKGDFYGLLNYVSIPFDLHYIVMRVNGFNNSVDYDGTPFVLLIPSLKEITILRKIFRTNKTAKPE
ncbi:MAG TPA: hypothetical protein VN843_01485 [Anaerolineales bacterium]|nr:hypothetical protein [Anaerolineales bacterium]